MENGLYMKRDVRYEGIYKREELITILFLSVLQ